MRFQKHDGFYNGYPAVRGATSLHFKYDTIGYIAEKGSSVGYGLAIWSSNTIVENCFFSDCGRRAISNNLYLAQEFANRRVIENVHIRNNRFVRGQHTTSLDLASQGDRDVSERPDTMRNIYFYNNIIDDSYIRMEGSDEGSKQAFTQ